MTTAHLEYVKLTDGERRYGQKSLLTMQLKILSATKHFFEYRRLRREEFTLKIMVKSQVQEAKEVIKTFESLLPKIEQKEQPIKEKTPLPDAEELTLDEEIAQLRKRLDHLLMAQ